ncbi:YpdA family putative bacillithiol disulfide reductase [Salinicoccus halitifaciens]|uniref:YpdA family bacillithiol system oxidoreductase n=1 Tax=Salinicoccus halitifaciens TaxID=1073415 RepID=A0ABV2E6D7_9STAP|nr:YpdA family putative bacillithiol disulfide reductase [Salinicoccus halitifaciens]MCD2136950.1 YpdA family putative bacillithiol disulfide reductase [Salinicoccus halitifaciens]
MEYFETIIIGAGPCGLAAAVELERNDMDYLVLESHNIVNAIYNYPTHQTFFSSSEKIAIGDFPFITEDHKPKRNQALVYYREVVKHFDLNIRIFEKVTSGSRTDEGFIIETDKNNYSCRHLIVATGYYGQPNRLDVPGGDKSKVSHYFKEAHPYFNSQVLVVGGRNSSADAAIELEKAGARVTVIHRRGDYSKSIKPWVLPQLKSLVEHGRIRYEFNTELLEVKEDSAVIRTGDEVKEIKNDFVLAMIGYRPDYDFLRSFGITLTAYEDGYAPSHDPATMETNIENLYLAGVVAAGDDANTIFIENGRFHGKKIIRHIMQKSAYGNQHL